MRPSGGAKTLGLDRELGSIEVGKLADLVVLDRNPLKNIRHTVGGTTKRPPFWFEGR